MNDQQPEGTAIVTLPAEIDLANADEVSGQFAAALVPGITTVIADLTTTTFCDSSGLREIVRARKRADATGATLRLVIASPHIARLFNITGLDRYLAIYPTLAAAHADGPPPVTETPG